MRVVGYVREAPDPQEGEPAFAQTERIRRWAADHGHQLVSVCQDVRTPGRPLGREGLRALLGIVAAGEVDAVVIAELDVLSPDKVAQEIMIWDIRHRGAAVLSADDDEVPLLEDPSPDQIRTVVRDVLAKADRYRSQTGDVGREGGDGEPTILQVDEASDVIVELIPPDRHLNPADRARPAR